MTEQKRVPERAAARIVAALQRLEAAQAAARETVDTVGDALGVPDGWTLGGDGEGLYFAPAAADSATPAGQEGGEATTPRQSGE